MFALARRANRGWGLLNVLHTIDFTPPSHKEPLYPLTLRLSGSSSPPASVTFEATNRIKLLERADPHQVTAGSYDSCFAPSIPMYSI